MFATRGEGDADSTKSIIADTAKLVGNSCFSKTIVDKDRHRRVLCVDGHAAISKVVASFCGIFYRIFERRDIAQAQAHAQARQCEERLRGA